MQSETHHTRMSAMFTMLAGLQTGILSGIWMLLLLSLISLRHGRSVWSASNLFATLFYGEEALRRGLRWFTLSGASLHLVVSALLGILFAFATSSIENRTYLRLLGVGSAIAWYWICDEWLWENWTPYLSLYAARFDMVAGHMLFGYLLAAYPRYRRALVAVAG